MREKIFPNRVNNIVDILRQPKMSTPSLYVLSNVYKLWLHARHSRFFSPFPEAELQLDRHVQYTHTSVFITQLSIRVQNSRFIIICN